MTDTTAPTEAATGFDALKGMQAANTEAAPAREQKVKYSFTD
jgi:hypothetical protein